MTAPKTRTIVDPTQDEAEPLESTEQIVFGDEDTLTIHFLEDGFTALGESWYRGQELTFERTEQPFKDTCDRLGQSWLRFAHDEMAQIERYGVLFFRSGPWPGLSYQEKEAAEKEAQRRGRPPLLPSLPTSVAPS